MPGRKPHKKSRTGCHNCKKRRVKCDEQGPPCSTCTLHNDRCVYPPTRLAPPPPKPHVCTCRHDSLSRVCQGDGFIPPRSDPSPQTNTLELELWHKWTFGTYQFFINDKPNGNCESWQVLVPKLALQCDYLRNAILAISAMHIVLESPNPMQPGHSPYMLAALEYHNAACQAFRFVKNQAITQTETEDGIQFTAVFAFSVINLAFALGLSQFHDPLDQRTGKSTSVLGHITMLFGLLKSIGTVIVSNILEFSRGPLPITLDVFSESRWHQLDKDTEVALKRLEAVTARARQSQSNREIAEANSQALLWLEKCFVFYSDENEDVILIWPMAIDTAFTQALWSGEDDVSRLMLMHWSVLLHRFGDGKRFSRGLGSRLADEMARLIPKKDKLWEESILWVQQEVGLLTPKANRIENSH